MCIFMVQLPTISTLTDTLPYTALFPPLLRDYPRIFAAIFVVAGVVWIAMSDGVVDVKGKPLGYDFITFYSASEVARDAGAPAVYDLRAMAAAQLAIAPGTAQPYAWHYPPTFQIGRASCRDRVCQYV